MANRNVIGILVFLASFAPAGCSLLPLENRALSNNRHIRVGALKRIRHMEEDQRKPLVKPMIEALSSGDDKITNRATEALMAIGEPAVDQLIAATSSTDPFLRTMAVTILGEIGAPANRIGPELVAALDDKHPLVRAEAAHALGQLGAAGMGGVPALVLTLSDPDPEVREAAKIALKKIGVDVPETPKTMSGESAPPAAQG